ncbi:MAG: MATE family efflux transporter [Eubacteriales bacterium]
MWSIGYYFSTKSMVKSNIDEEILSSKEAYTNFLKMAWPCVLEALLMCLVNVVDTFMVSTLGTNAIAAVGITSQPKFLLFAIFFSLNVGVTAVVARRKGEDNRESANMVLKESLLVGLFFGIIMAIVGIAVANPLLRLAGAELHYLDDAIIYFRIISVSIFFQGINIIINAAHRGCGNTKITMVTNMIANITNIFFNYVLINGKLGFPKLGIKGAALATTIGCMVACLVAIITLFRKKSYLNIFIAYKEKVTLHSLKSVFQVSSSALVEQIFLRIGFMLYGMLAAKLGTVSYATHLICMTILNLSFSFGDGFSIAASSLVGQMLGAKQVVLAKMYGKVGQRVAFIVSTGLCIFFYTGRNVLIQIFSEDPEIIAMGANILIIMACSTHLQTSQLVSSGCLRGAGDSRYVAMTALLSVAVVRPLSTYLLCFVLSFGIYGAWFALMIDQMIRLTFAMKRLAGGRWSEIKL